MKQTLMAQLIAEVEYRSMDAKCCEVTWLKNF